MKYLKLLLAFGFGWVAVAALSPGAGVKAWRHETEIAQSAPFQSRINALKQRVAYLEHQAGSGELTKKVIAPFEVVNQAGQRIFYVSPDRDVEIYKGGKRVTVMSAGGGFGTFWVLSDKSSWNATLSPRNFVVNENGEARVDLGKDYKKGNYRLVFFKGDKTLSAIGVSSVSGGGIALVDDGSGSQKADIATTVHDTGSVEVLRGSGFNLVRLTEGESKGGALVICSANGCNPLMVSAGDVDGRGVVTTGPDFYIQGPTGAPGSFLIGKRQ